MTDAQVAVTAAVIAACAAIASAGISALTSWSMSRRTGIQKIAEFRKEWIENLRIHFAEFHSICVGLTIGIRQYRRQKNEQERHRLSLEIKDKYERLHYLHNYILLMLNPSEELHQEMERKLRQIFKELTDNGENGDGPSPESSALNLQEYSQLARKILKAEWSRLKSES
jgi:hypothetical protein